MIQYIKKQDQNERYIFNNKFIENQPIPFPDSQTKHTYSNLFYWAHLVALDTAAFPLHPHEGFEIMTFVLKGTLEHYDTKTQVWTPIQEGGFQIIQAGSGLQHSEKILKDSEVFQIWFDPDFSKTLQARPMYQDYSKEAIKSETIDGITRYEYVGEKTFFKQTDDIRITKEIYPVGNYSIKLDTKYIYSIYVIQGIASIDSHNATKDDFIVCEDMDSLEIQVEEELQLFVVKTPKEILYKTIS